MKLSAVVITYNEQNYLEECLKHLSGCDQILVVDLYSKDNCVQIAQKYATQVLQHEREPIAEFVLPDIVDNIENDWFIRVDPDEILSGTLLDDIKLCIEIHPDAAIVKIPFEYYFLGRALKTTSWGGIRHLPKVLNKKRTVIYKRVHGAFEPKQGFKIYQVNYDGQNEVRHYWIDSYKMLREKHGRYLRLEGKSRYDRGLRFSWGGMFYEALKVLHINFIQKNGWRGGWTGWFLSFFHANYELHAWLSLRKSELTNQGK